MDQIVEGFSFIAPEVVVIFLTSISNHIKISTNVPRNVVVWGDFFDLIKESGAEFRNGGA